MWKFVVVSAVAFLVGSLHAPGAGGGERGAVPKARRVFLVDRVESTSHRKDGDPYWIADKLDEAVAQLEKEGWTVIDCASPEKDWVVLLCERAESP